MTTTAELRSKRDQKEQEITDIAHRIEDRIDFYKDWQKMVRDYPLQSMGIAMGAGLLVSGMGGGLVRFGLRQAEGLVRAGLMAYLLAWLNDASENRKVVNAQRL
ncbi:hypothetical protein [Vampirovibrio sp.]|uniref:hypothetical protein n=1 Tax=Vampirovibrio sp. TaxID=2717857 RepID=UPI003594115F